MSGYIKYFDGSRESMSFFSKDEITKYNKIWKTTKTYGFKLDSQSVYDKKYVKNEAKNIIIKSILFFSDNDIPKEKTHHYCIRAICIDFVLKLNEIVLKCI